MVSAAGRIALSSDVTGEFWHGDERYFHSRHVIVRRSRFKTGRKAATSVGVTSCLVTMLAAGDPVRLRRRGTVDVSHLDWLKVKTVVRYVGGGASTYVDPKYARLLDHLDLVRFGDNRHAGIFGFDGSELVAVVMPMCIPEFG